jgi:hypothetical protein
MRKNLIRITILAAVGLAGCVSPSPATNHVAPVANHVAPVGYTDTPMLPSGKWHVHDPARPAPPVVTPSATFSDGAPAPSDAIVLFDGHDLSHWAGDKGEPQWKVQDGYMEVVPHSGYIHTKEDFGDFQLHVEWAEPAKVKGNSQERGNSGVFLQGIYELQVLDSYDNPTYADGQCGGMYGQTPPLANACKKPGEWQTYDIIFEAARFGDDHQLIRPASVTVIQNGVLLHHKQAFLGPTGHKILANYKKETPDRGPIALQDHGNPVRFRNIWIRNIAEEEKP